MALLAALLLSIAAASCGGGDDPGESGETIQPRATEAQQTPRAGDDAQGQSEAPEGDDAAAEAASEPAGRQIGEFQDVIFVLGDESEATFTVEEQLARLPLPIDAVMRTGALAGEVRLDGGPSTVEIDLTTLTSDQEFRDRYVQTRMFGSHPTAVFSLASVGDLPDGFAEGETVSATATGTLKMLGSEFPLSFDIEARDDGHSVFVLGATEFTWEQFGIPVPTARSVVWVADTVRVQVLLQLIPRTDG